MKTQISNFKNVIVVCSFLRFVKYAYKGEKACVYIYVVDVERLMQKGNETLPHEDSVPRCPA